MTSWLNKQKKQTLLELSSEAGLKQDGDTLKDDIVEQLDDYLQKNATRLSRNSSFEPYYTTRRTPFKARSSSGAGLTSDDGGAVKSVVKAGGKRKTAVKSEDEGEGSSTSPLRALIPSSSSLTTRTPAAARPRQSALPASPADVADNMERAARRMSSGIDNMYSKSGIPDSITYVRDLCSSVVGLQTAFLLLEGISLSYNLLWMNGYPLYSFKALNLLGFKVSQGVTLPNLFELLESRFWLPTIYWSSTSIFIPLLFAYFFNLSIRDVKRHGTKVSEARYPVDPLVFNMVKIVMTHIVFFPGVMTPTFLHEASVLRVNAAVVGGVYGMLVAGYVGVAAAIYDAAQSK